MMTKGEIDFDKEKFCLFVQLRVRLSSRARESLLQRTGQRRESGRKDGTHSTSSASVSTSTSSSPHSTSVASALAERVEVLVSLGSSIESLSLSSHHFRSLLDVGRDVVEEALLLVVKGVGRGGRDDHFVVFVARSVVLVELGVRLLEIEIGSGQRELRCGGSGAKRLQLTSSTWLSSRLLRASSVVGRAGESENGSTDTGTGRIPTTWSTSRSRGDAVRLTSLQTEILDQLLHIFDVSLRRGSSSGGRSSGRRDGSGRSEGSCRVGRTWIGVRSRFRGRRRRKIRGRGDAVRCWGRLGDLCGYLRLRLRRRRSDGSGIRGGSWRNDDGCDWLSWCGGWCGCDSGYDLRSRQRRGGVGRSDSGGEQSRRRSETLLELRLSWVAHRRRTVSTILSTGRTELRRVAVRRERRGRTVGVLGIVGRIGRKLGRVLLLLRSVLLLGGLLELLRGRERRVGRGNLRGRLSGGRLSDGRRCGLQSVMAESVQGRCACEGAHGDDGGVGGRLRRGGGFDLQVLDV